MELPRLDPETERFYESVLPSDDQIETRSMFGGLGSFVNGNMFCCALGRQVFLRLSETDRRPILQEPGSSPFEPVQGHRMAEYVTVPESWMRSPDRVRGWIGRSLEWVAAMPPKKGKKKARTKKR